MRRHDDSVDRTDEWAELRERYVVPHERRAPTTARGVHHTAHISLGRRQDDRLLPGPLGFPLTELFENRDYPGSTHFFFDIGNGNALAFFDFPGLDVGPYQRCSAGTTTWRSALRREQWEELRRRLDEAGIEHHDESGVSMYFRDPTASDSS